MPYGYFTWHIITSSLHITSPSLIQIRGLLSMRCRSWQLLHSRNLLKVEGLLPELLLCWQPTPSACILNEDVGDPCIRISKKFDLLVKPASVNHMPSAIGRENSAANWARAVLFPAFQWRRVQPLMPANWSNQLTRSLIVQANPDQRRVAFYNHDFKSEFVLKPMRKKVECFSSICEQK